MKLAARAQRIEPFYVMEIAKAADELVRSAGSRVQEMAEREHRPARRRIPARRRPSAPVRA